MPPPERIWKVGTVVIKYRDGHNGPTRAQLVSWSDFGRLIDFVEAYAELDRIKDLPETRPNQQMRKEMAMRLGLRPSPRRGTPPTKKFDFTTYTLKGMIRRSAVEEGQVTLEPKHIVQVEFKHPVHVSN